MTDRVMIYTAIFGDYDALHEPEYVPEHADFVAFTDAPRESKTWRIRQVALPDPDFSRSNRHFKLLPHRYFPDHAISVYLDGNVILRNDVHDLIHRHLADASMAVFNHTETGDKRDCIYDEYEAILEIGKTHVAFKDDPATMAAQMERYRREGYPAHHGLTSNGLLLRRHHEPDVVRTMEDWWTEVSHGSKRDQLAFNYVAWKNDFRFNHIPGNLRDHRYCYTVKHEKRIKRIRATEAAPV